jgi:uncharacterized protein YcbX
MSTIVELVRYPIKGCAGSSAPDSELKPAGLAHDRSFMVIGEDGTFRSQRRDPRLAVIRPEVADETLTLRAPGVEPVVVGVDSEGPRRDVMLFGAPYRGIDQGELAASWLSDVLGVASRLVRVPPEHDRVTDGLTPGTSGYADSSALLVVSRSSLDLLNERIASAGGEAVPMNRFRPNIVVDGWAEPHVEDTVRRATVGDAELGFTKIAIRCAVTLVDQETGVRAGPEPVRTLARYRRAPGGGVAFGAKFAVLRPGKLTVGDEFVVTGVGVSRDVSPCSKATFTRRGGMNVALLHPLSRGRRSPRTPSGRCPSAAAAPAAPHRAPARRPSVPPARPWPTTAPSAGASGR